MNAKQTCRFIFSVILIISLCSGILMAQTVTDDFNRTTLGANWQAHADMSIQNGRLHNSGTLGDWVYHATFNGLTNPTEVSMTWANAPFCDDDGAKSSGLLIMCSTFSPSPSGYFIYERNGKIYLFSMVNGAITAQVQVKNKATGTPSAGPGKTLTVRFSAADFSFQVFIDNQLLGTLQDLNVPRLHNYTTYYSGVSLFGGTTTNNDIESYTAQIVASGDNTAPSAVSNLSATALSASSIRLNWTATGDDGSVGQASYYDLRRSTSLITAANFNSATQVGGLPSPNVSGQAETFTVSGLSQNTQYYFALKVGDEALNWSGLSNNANATTLEGTEPVTLLSFTDRFERTTLGADWAATGFHQIQSNALGLSAGATAEWRYLATFIRPFNIQAVAMTFDEELADNEGATTAGLAVMLDSPSSTADGYLILHRGSLALYKIEGGQVVGNYLVRVGSPGHADPQAGDEIKAEVQVTDTQQIFTVRINGTLDGVLTLNNPTHTPDTWYAGVMQVGTYNNYIDIFTVWYQGGAEATRMEEHYGNYQSGPIFTQLPDSIAVKVTDATGTPFEGTVVDFKVMQGQASLSIEDFEFDGWIWRECESGSVVTPATVEQDETAAGGAYVVTPYVEGNYGRGRSIMPIYVPEIGNFDLYLRLICPTSNSNSLYYKIDDADSVEVRYSSTWTTWVWKQLRNITLDAGFHQIHILTREPGVKFDKIVMVDRNKNPSWTPSGKGGVGPILPNVSNEAGIAYTYVTFKADADTDVVVHATAFRSDGFTMLDNSPIPFTLDPTPSKAESMERDPATPDPMTGSPGTKMDTPLKALIYDQYGNRVPDVTVNWTITQGGGTLDSPTSVSNELGEAINYLTLSLTQTTSYLIQASSSGLLGSPVQFTVIPGNPPKFLQNLGPFKQQTTFAGTKVDSLLTVKVLTEEETPFENYPVEFVVTKGGGSVAAPATGALLTDGGRSRRGEQEMFPVEAAGTVIIRTDANGIARAEWTLGNQIGVNEVEARATSLVGSPVIFTALGELGLPSQLVKVSGDDPRQNGPVGLALQQPFVVKLTDAYNNGIPSKAIEFRILQGQDAYIGTAGTLNKTVFTDATGKASIVLTMGSQVGEEHVVRATAVGTEIDPLHFTAMATEPIASNMEYFSGNGTKVLNRWIYQDTVVTRTLKDPFVVKVTGPFGEPVADHPVLFSVIQGGGNFGGATERTVNTDGNGQAAVKLTLGVTAGDSIHVVEATSYRIDFITIPLEGAPVIFKATGRPKTAAKLIVDEETNNQVAQVGQPLEKPIRAQVRDIHDNFVPNHLVTFRVQGEGGMLENEMGLDKVKQITTSATDGYASVIWYMPNTPGTFGTTVEAFTPGGDPLQGSPTEMIASAKEGSPDSLVKVTADTVLKGTVGKPLAQKLKVRVVDRYINPVPNYPVTFTVKTGYGKVNGAPQVTFPTDGSGIAEVEWTLGEKSGVENNSVEATASIAGPGRLVTFLASARPDVPIALKCSQTDENGNVGEFLEDPIEVKIADIFNNGVPNHPVEFFVIDVGGNIGYLETVGQTELTVQTDTDGYARVNWALGSKPGSKTNKLTVISRRLGTHLQGSPHEIYGSALTGVPTKLVKTTDDANLAVVVGNPVPGDLRVKVTDSFGNPLARQKVTFEVISRKEAIGGTLDGQIDSIKVKETNDNGVASVQFYVGSRAGIKINKVQARATYQGESLQGSPVLFEVTGLETLAKEIAGTDGNGQVGFVGRFLPRALVVTAYDQYKNAVKGQPIRFQITNGTDGGNIGSLGEGTATDTTINTNDQGKAIVKWRLGQKVGVYNLAITSKSGEVHLKNSPISFTATASADSSDADKSTLVATPAEVPVSNGQSKAEIVITLRDKYDNPVKGRFVLLTATGEAQTENPTQKTNADGEAIGYISSRTAGVKYITAWVVDDEVTLSDSAVVNFKAAAAAKLDKPKEDGDGQTGNIGTVLSLPLAAVVTDNYGNPIINYPVSFVITEGGGQLLDNSPVFTDSSGIARARIALGPTQGTNRIEARASGLDGSPLSYVLFGITPSQVTSLKIISGNHLTACPGEELAEPLCVELNDINGWRVWGQSVTFEDLHGDGLFMSENPTKSDRHGMACVRAHVGTKVGINVFRAALTANKSITTTFYDTTMACSASKIEYFSGSDLYGQVGLTLTTPLTVRTLDQYDNPVAGIEVTFGVLEDISVDGVGTLEGGNRVITKKSDVNGMASAYFTFGNRAGVYKVRASSGSLKPPYVEFILYALAANPHSMEVRSGDNQRMEMGRDLLYPICVTIRDQHGNAAANGYVTFYVTKGGGEIITTQPVASDPKGRACARWKLGPHPDSYDNRAEAIASLAGGPFRIEFKANGDNAHWPLFQLPASKEVNENVPVNIPVIATDEDNDWIDYQAANLPDTTATFTRDNSGNWQFNWTPGYGTVRSPQQFKSFYPKFIAQDKNGMDIDSVEVVVYNVNRAPVIESYWPLETKVIYDPAQQYLPFGVNAVDPDGDQLFYKWMVNGRFVSSAQTFNMDLVNYPLDKAHTVIVEVSDQDKSITHDWIAATAAVIVEIESFTSKVVPYKGVTLEWSTGNEIENLGFDVLRSTNKEGQYIRINEQMIAKSESHQYRYVDVLAEAGKRYYYKIEDISRGGFRTQHGPVEAQLELPKKYSLAQNYPNPFNPATTIRFEMPKAEHVQIQVFNIRGELVRTLIDRVVEAGYHSILWDSVDNYGFKIASGVYYYRIIAGDFKMVKKMAFIK